MWRGLIGWAHDEHLRIPTLNLLITPLIQKSLGMLPNLMDSSQTDEHPGLLFYKLEGWLISAQQENFHISQRTLFVSLDHPLSKPAVHSIIHYSNLSLHCLDQSCNNDVNKWHWIYLCLQVVFWGEPIWKHNPAPSHLCHLRCIRTDHQPTKCYELSM